MALTTFNSTEDTKQDSLDIQDPEEVTEYLNKQSWKQFNGDQ